MYVFGIWKITIIFKSFSKNSMHFSSFLIDIRKFASGKSLFSCKSSKQPVSKRQSRRLSQSHFFYKRWSQYVSYWITTAFDLALLLHSVTGTSADGHVLGIGGLKAVDFGQTLGRVALAVLGPAITDVGQQNNNSWD